jgi:plastocyanin
MRQTMRVMPVVLFIAAAAAAAACNNPQSPTGSVSGSISLAGAAGNSAQELARAVVYFESHASLSQQPQRDEPRPQIVQRDKAFVPDLLVVRQGTVVEFPNWDPFSHNVFSRSRAASFDLDRYGQGQSKSYRFDTTGVVQVFCNIHPQMRAVVLVVPNRFYVRADAQGRFSLRDVPIGQYELVAWHARFGEQKKKISVTPEGLRNVSFDMSGGGTRESADTRESRQRPRGVERGLGVKREKLNLPVVTDSHAAPPPKQ